MDSLKISYSNDSIRNFINASSSSSVDHYSATNFQRFLFAYDSVNKFYTPILFLFGAIGNGLSLTVFCTAPSHRHLSSSFYLSALAISDFGYLLNLLAVWLEDMGLHVITQAKWVCPTVMFLGQVTCFLSVWLTVSFTAERFFAVCYPLTRPTVCTVARAKKVIMILFLIAIVAFSYVWVIAIVVDFPLATTSPENIFQEDPEFPYFEQIEHVRNNSNFNSSWDHDRNMNMNWTVEHEHEHEPEHGETMRVCYVREEYMYLSSIASHTDTVFTLIIPWLIISYLNIRIALTVWKFKDQRQSIVACPKASNFHAHNHNIQESRQNHLSSSSPSVITGLTVAVSVGQTRTSINSLDHLYPKSKSKSNANRMKFSTVKDSNGSNGSLSTLGEICNATNHNMGVATLNPNQNQNQQQQQQHNQSGRSHHSSSASETRITKTLLLVSTVFLVLNLPAHGIRAFAYIQSWWGLAMEEELQAAQQWANILFNTNFSVNFLLYCCSGENFRKSLWNVCFKRKSVYNIKGNRRMILSPSPSSFKNSRSQNNQNQNKVVITDSDQKEHQHLMSLCVNHQEDGN